MPERNLTTIPSECKMIGKRHIKPVCGPVPRDVLLQPPICSARDKLQGKLTPLEFALAVSLLGEARLQLKRDNIARASAVGAKAIALQRKYADEYREEIRRFNFDKRRGVEPFPVLERQYTFALSPEAAEHFFPLKGRRQRPPSRKVTTKLAGKVAYRAELYRLQSSAVKQVVVTLTRSAWLDSAGLGRTTSNRLALDASLAILTAPLVVGRATKAPLLLGYKVVDNKLRLQVSGFWLQPAFGFIPLPLPPTCSVHGLALWMFLHAINTNESNPKTSSLKALCKIISIDCKRKYQQRDLDRAINVVNDYLKALDVCEAADHRLREYKSALPLRYNVEYVGKMIKFIAVARSYNNGMDDEFGGYEDEAAPEAAPVVYKRKAPPRPRLTEDEVRRRGYATAIAKLKGIDAE